MDPGEQVDIGDQYVELTVLAYIAIQRYEDFLKGVKGSNIQLARAMKDIREFIPTDIGDFTDA